MRKNNSCSQAALINQLLTGTLGAKGASLMTYLVTSKSVDHFPWLCSCSKKGFFRSKIVGIAYATGKRRLISASDDGLIVFWDMNAKREEVRHGGKAFAS